MSFRVLGDPYRTIGGSLGRGSLGSLARPGQFVTFEAGVVTPYPTGFNAVAGVAANLSVTPGAAMAGNYGLNVAVAAGGESHGQLTQMSSLTQTTIRLLFDPNSIVMANNNIFTIVRVVDSGGGQAYALNLRYTAALGYDLVQNLVSDGGGNNFGFTPAIVDDISDIKIILRFADAGLNNGYSLICVNGVLCSTVQYIDNDTRNMNRLDVGAVLGIDAGTNGNIFYDNIRWYNRIV